MPNQSRVLHGVRAAVALSFRPRRQRRALQCEIDAFSEYCFGKTRRVSKQHDRSALEDSGLVAQRDRVPAVFDRSAKPHRWVTIDELHQVSPQRRAPEGRIATHIEMIALREYPSVSFGHATEIEHGTIAEAL